MTPYVRIFISIVVFAVLGGCASDDDRQRQPVTVFAASSLTDAFTALEPAFEAAHPDLDLQLVFAGSQVLRLQLEQGASADVFASANAEHIDALAGDNHLGGVRPLADNALAVITPSSARGVERFTDLADANSIVLGSENVPVGAYADELLDRARASLGDSFVDQVEARIVSREMNARLVRAKIELGEADAAIVYQTDAVGFDHARIVPIPDDLDVRAHYHIGWVANDAPTTHGRRFIEYATSPDGFAILAAHGFLPASE